MKKVLLILLCVSLSLFVVSCGQELSDHRFELDDYLTENTDAPTDKVSYTGSVKKPTIEISLKKTVEYSDVGMYFKEIMVNCKDFLDSKEYGVNEVAIIVPDKNDETAFALETNDFNIYTYMDGRSGEIKAKPLTSIDDLKEDFPAMKYAEVQNKLDPADKELYNEIMDQLNSDMSRPEDDIIEEIAPEYGMTPQEIKDFLNDTLTQIETFMANE